MPYGLLHYSVAGIHENHCQIGRGCSGNHVPGILDMAWSIGNDEFPLRSGEIPVGHVDGDALLPLGTESVRQESQVDFLIATASGSLLDSLELVLENRLRVIEKPAYERALSVIHTARRSEAEQLHIEISFCILSFHVVFL